VRARDRKDRSMEKLLLTILILTTFGMIVWGVARLLVAKMIVLDYQRAMLYQKGRFIKLLEPGLYWYMPFSTKIVLMDIRAQTVTVGGQEVLSLDGVTIKMSLAVQFAVADPVIAQHKAVSYDQVLYQQIQLALRDSVGRRDMDTVMEDRAKIAEEMLALCKPKLVDFGLDLQMLDIKDIMFPGKMKEIYARVAQAKKEGLALLEKARGESAALRHLANVAKLCEDNPSLMQLRLIQALGESSGHTVVLGGQEMLKPVPAPGKRATQSEGGDAT